MHHNPNQFRKSHARLPTEYTASLRSVSHQVINFRGAKIACVNLNVIMPVEPSASEGRFDELADRVGLACPNYVVVGLVLLEHEPHGSNIIGSIAPISAGVKISYVHLLLEAQF